MPKNYILIKKIKFNKKHNKIEYNKKLKTNFFKFFKVIYFLKKQAYSF